MNYQNEKRGFERGKLTMFKKTAQQKAEKAIKGIDKAVNVFAKMQNKLLKHKDELLDANNRHESEIQKRNQHLVNNMAHIESIEKVVEHLDKFTVGK